MVVCGLWIELVDFTHLVVFSILSIIFAHHMFDKMFKWRFCSNLHVILLKLINHTNINSLDYQIVSSYMKIEGHANFTLCPPASMHYSYCITYGNHYASHIHSCFSLLSCAWAHVHYVHSCMYLGLNSLRYLTSLVILLLMCSIAITHVTDASKKDKSYRQEIGRSISYNRVGFYIFDEKEVFDSQFSSCPLLVEREITISDLLVKMAAIFTSPQWEPVLRDFIPQSCLLVWEFYSYIHEIDRLYLECIFQVKFWKFVPRSFPKLLMYLASSPSFSIY